MDDLKDIKRVIKAFALASQQVVSQMTKCEIEIGKAYEKKESSSSYDYSFIIGIAGGYEGSVTMSLKEDTAFFIASAMLGGKPIEKFDDLAESTIREISNTVVALAFTKLEDGGDSAVDITPPTFMKGDSPSSAALNTNRTFVTTLDTPKGVIEFNISLLKTGD